MYILFDELNVNKRKIKMALVIIRKFIRKFNRELNTIDSFTDYLLYKPKESLISHENKFRDIQIVPEASKDREYWKSRQLLS